MKTILLTMLMTLSLTSAAKAQDNVEANLNQDLTPIVIDKKFTIKSGDTKIISLPRYSYLDRVSLEVNAGFLCGENSFNVSFEGYARQSVSFKGGLRGSRNKILTANVWARTIEIQNTSPCKIKVDKIEVLPRRWSQGRNQGQGSGHRHPGPVYSPVSEAGAQVSFLLENIMYLESLVADSDRTTFITPAKRVLGKALAVLSTVPETSQASLQAIQDVVNQLRVMKPLTDRLASIEATFEISQEIQSVEAALERMIR